MKKKSLRALMLNKKSISQLSNLKGGFLFSNQRSCNCSNDSYCDCVSNEPNCHSDNPGCDCGTTGNCEKQ